MPLLRTIEPDADTRIGVWKITESSAELAKNDLLDPADLKTVAGFGSEIRRKQWLACRNILALLMQQPVRIRYDGNGRPCLTSSGENISITHSGNMAAVIVGKNHEVGIDIEKIRDRIERVKERFLSTEELQWIGTEDRLEKLYILWGVKETIYKLTGSPLLDFHTNIFVEPFDYLCHKKGSCVARVKTDGEEKRISLDYEKLDDYLLVYTRG